METSLGPLFIDIAGTALTSQDQSLLQQPAVGGIIFFTRNYQDKAQLKALVDSIRQIRSDIIIAVDHEGGRVQRFHDGFTRLNDMATLGQLCQHDSSAALSQAASIGTLIADELTECGIDLNFGPVLDCDIGISSIIGARSFHSDPFIVSQCAIAMMNAMHQAGMPAVGKHFPGHGAVQADSHLQLPQDDRQLAQLQEQDLIPFQQTIDNGLAGLMTAHIVFPHIDPHIVTFSEFWLNQYCRQTMGFEGVIFSDDLSMAGAKSLGQPIERVNAALQAGCDFILLCNDRAAVIDVVNSLQYNPPALREQRLTNFLSKRQS